MNLISLIMSTGIILGIFLGILLLTITRGNIYANRLLGAILIISSICISDFAASRLGYYNQYPFLLGIPTTFLFLLGPLFYFYFKSLTDHNFRISRKSWPHFTPFILLIIYRLPFFLMNDSDKLAAYDTPSYDIAHRITIALQIINAFSYLFIIKKNQFRQGSKPLTSNDQLNLSWISHFITLTLVIFFIAVIHLILSAMDIKLSPLFPAIIPAMISFTILYLGFRGLRQPIIFPEGRVGGKKYEKSTLTEEQAEQKLKQLFQIMDEEKPYLRQDLTLQKLADSLSISPHHLSQIINEKTGQNFFDFVNAYRIQTAKKMLLEESGKLFTILAISEESGFNSKSSFNTAFKKHTGTTPSNFRNSAPL